MDEWPSDELLQNIAWENNLSETAYLVKNGENWHLRWFALNGEIDLCGHATLAAAYTILEHIRPGADQVHFDTLSGPIGVEKRNGRYCIDFPAYELHRVEVTADMAKALGARPAEAWMGRDLLCVFEDEETVRCLSPDQERVKALPGLLCHVTAPGKEFDCVSRSFAPKANVVEDPVCGSGHCHIVPYWARRLGQQEVVAYQASRRGGTLYAKMKGERVELAGHAALFSIDEIDLS